MFFNPVRSNEIRKFLRIIFFSIIILIAGYVLYNNSTNSKNNANNSKQDSQNAQIVALKQKVVPTKGFVLPVKWRDLGKQLVESGAIDSKKLESIYATRGDLSEKDKLLIMATNDDNLSIDMENSGILLNLLWALGLANKNSILEDGPMAKEGDTGNFASTGGWNIAENNAMDHYSKHELIKLTAEQQKLVEEVSKGIYRPCCDNSTYFPDCNHGMAMLGLIELMASQGVSMEEMYATALKVNSFWFSDTYLAIGKYFQDKNIEWSAVRPSEVLAKEYSSAPGYQKIRSQVNIPQGFGVGCSI